MRRFFPVLLLALILSAAPVAHAQFFDAMGDEYSTAEEANAADIANNAVAARFTEGVTSEQYAANAAAREAAEKSTAPPGGTADDSYNSIMMKIMQLFAWIVGVAMVTLNYAAYYTVVTMGQLVKNFEAIGLTWQILRDIGNIFLIFGFLAVGITTILNVDWYGGGKKMLPMMLIAAVFLNFSLFITEAVIDVGNLFATQLYTQINGGTALTSVSSLNNEGLSGKIMSQLGLQRIYGEAQRGNKDILGGTAPWIIGFMGILLFIILAFVLFSLAFMLIARFVMLVYLIILSPIGFAGFAIPQLANKSKEWRDKLVEQTITAPILFLLLYIALRIITATQFLTGFNRDSGVDANWLGTIGADNVGGFASIFLSFLVAMGFLIMVVIQAKNLGAAGASAVMNVANAAKSGATKFAMGSLKFAGRGALGAGIGAGRWTANRSVGRLSHMASQGIMKTGFGQTQLGRLAATGFAKGGQSFKEAKEKSVKKHEDYRNEVAKALEAKHAPGIANAQVKRATAEKAIESQVKAAEAAKNAKAAAEQKAKPLTDEVARLEKASEKAIREQGAPNLAIEEALAKAKAAAAPAEKEVEDADNKVKATQAAFEKARKDSGLDEALEEEKDATDTLAKAKREAAVTYGENARTGMTDKLNPFTWIAAGPGGIDAGNKIIQDTLKKMSDTEKAIDMLKKAVASEAKAADKSTKAAEGLNKEKRDLTKKTAEEAKPAPPPPPATPAP